MHAAPRSGAEFSSCGYAQDCTDCGIRPVQNTGNDDSCATANDGQCTDGGFAATGFTCSFGSDRSDCRDRIICTHPGIGVGTLMPQHNYDGVCDDGGPGAEYYACDYGTDAYDCGNGRGAPVDVVLFGVPVFVGIIILLSLCQWTRRRQMPQRRVQQGSTFTSPVASAADQPVVGQPVAQSVLVQPVLGQPVAHPAGGHAGGAQMGGVQLQPMQQQQCAASTTITTTTTSTMQQQQQQQQQQQAAVVVQGVTAQ